MNSKSILYLCCVLFLAGNLLAQVPSPAPAQKTPILVQGGTIHIGNGQVIDKGDIRIENGKITYIGASQQASTTDAEVINAAGKHVYPGLILLNTVLGLTEIGAVRATVDEQETGQINPHVRSIIAYNTDSEVIAVTRSNGILLAQVTPQGGLVSGTSSVVQLDAWNWEDAAFKTDEGLHINWVSMFQRPNFFAGETAVKKNERRKEVLQQADNLFKEAYGYAQIINPPVINARLEAMKGIFDGSKKVYIHADRAKEIMEAVKFAQDNKVKNIVIVGGIESYMITDFLKNNNISVILNHTFNLPSRVDDDVDLPYKMPYLLQKAGVKYAIGYEENHTQARNLPFAAGLAAGYGLSKEEALTSISLSPAQILGIADRTGSLEQGKDGTLIISEGDILDMRTSKVTHALIQGRKVNLDDKHKRLYQKFKTKYDNK
ncbi:MAG: amidohydrolase [Cytophagales bacterium]|nr:MAG: amidohydrolase [Cytophagales bacterium]